MSLMSVYLATLSTCRSAEKRSVFRSSHRVGTSPSSRAACGLSPAQLDEIRSLEERCLAAIVRMCGVEQIICQLLTLHNSLLGIWQFHVRHIARVLNPILHFLGYLLFK